MCDKNFRPHNNQTLPSLPPLSSQYRILFTIPSEGFYGLPVHTSAYDRIYHLRSLIIMSIVVPIKIAYNWYYCVSSSEILPFSYKQPASLQTMNGLLTNSGTLYWFTPLQLSQYNATQFLRPLYLIALYFSLSNGVYCHATFCRFY